MRICCSGLYGTIFEEIKFRVSTSACASASSADFASIDFVNHSMILPRASLQMQATAADDGRGCCWGSEPQQCPAVSVSEVMSRSHLGASSDLRRSIHLLLLASKLQHSPSISIMSPDPQVFRVSPSVIALPRSVLRLFLSATSLKMGLANRSSLL